MIVVNDLYTGYSRNSPLLTGFNYQFDDNKIYGVLGESGIGKTTLLRTISGLIKPLQGEVIVNGVKNSKPNKNEILSIASTSSNSKEIGKIISDAYFQVQNKNAIKIIESENED